MTRDQVTAQRALATMWHAEWYELTEPQTMAVLADYMATDVTDQVRYVSLIGRDNLTSYANTLLVGLIRRAHQTPIGQQWRGDEMTP